MSAEGVHEPVNLGNPVEFTIGQLAQEVCRIVGGDIRVTYRPLPEDDPVQRKPDISRAREWLGWEPRIDLASGLARTVEFFRNRARPKSRMDHQLA